MQEQLAIVLPTAQRHNHDLRDVGRTQFKDTRDLRNLGHSRGLREISHNLVIDVSLVPWFVASQFAISCCNDIGFR